MAEIVLNAVIRGQTVVGGQPFSPRVRPAGTASARSLLVPISYFPRRASNALSFRSSSFKFKSSLLFQDNVHDSPPCRLLVNSPHTFLSLLLLLLLSSHPATIRSAWSSAFLLLLQKSFNPSTANAFNTADLSERERKYFTKIAMLLEYGCSSPQHSKYLLISETITPVYIPR